MGFGKGDGMAGQRLASRLSDSAARVEVSRIRFAERRDANDPIFASRWMRLSPRREETVSEFSVRVSRTARAALFQTSSNRSRADASVPTRTLGAFFILAFAAFNRHSPYISVGCLSRIHASTPRLSCSAKASRSAASWLDTGSGLSYEIWLRLRRNASNLRMSDASAPMVCCND